MRSIAITCALAGVIASSTSCASSRSHCSDQKCAGPIGTKVTGTLFEVGGPRAVRAPLNGVLLVNHGESPLHSLFLRMPVGPTGRFSTYLAPGEYLFRAQPGPSGGVDCGSVMAKVAGTATTVNVTCHVT